MFQKISWARYSELIKMMKFLGNIKGYKLGYDSEWDGMIEYYTLRFDGKFLGRVAANNPDKSYFLNEIENA
jgi:hypothetical protein